MYEIAGIIIGSIGFFMVLPNTVTSSRKEIVIASLGGVLIAIGAVLTH